MATMIHDQMVDKNCRVDYFAYMTYHYNFMTRAEIEAFFQRIKQVEHVARFQRSTGYWRQWQAVYYRDN
jgi:hypothetical protein